MAKSQDEIEQPSYGSDKHEKFVFLVCRHPEIFNSLRLKQNINAKQKAWADILPQYQQLFRTAASEKQLRKQLIKMKSNLKNKITRAHTTGTQLTLKPWEKKLLDLWSQDPCFPKFPEMRGLSRTICLETTLSPIEHTTEDVAMMTGKRNEKTGAIVDDSHSESSDSSTLSVTSSEPPTKKPTMFSSSETNETRTLTTEGLTRQYLVEQLKLVNLQIVKESLKIQKLRLEVGMLAPERE